MPDEFEKKELEHLANIESELEEIKNRTPNARRAFLNGILQGGGAIVGGITAVALIGWALAASGVIPGLGHISQYLQNIVNQQR
jgi:hypothetical protein